MIESLAKKAVRCLAAEKPFNPKNYQAQKQLKIFSQLLGDPEEGQDNCKAPIFMPSLKWNFCGFVSHFFKING
ncbi:hypothetical protein AVI51_11990 [Piscirickettsia salmonis]|uniref:hypothetical protein n=1 Tax=Piscirickettsia salmonis TaxID=1238 RepID=UPI000332CC73|nr:hypothetical protein [Piscirickettsia salmonis]APS43706.1 hypothetical protein AVI48_04505 [Piscirickettsia salmonis]APS47060.1 hypothetical protein AVI49_05110 [Piscirickettsia salmonis]APS54709.1 hypothetical protein AVI51_11990 [Piscirickettsia salmonis]APS57805.1 hypothetical protein AVI52_11505 [Piscirickettsia salmonis]PEQ15718.1 hypothetical protein X973_11215 [Piscirickettsia salmonis]